MVPLLQLPCMLLREGEVIELGGGHVMLVEGGGTDGAGYGASLAAQVRGPAAVLRRLASVGTTGSLQDALARRHALGVDESLVTPDGIWVGRDWLRVARGRDAHAGVLERESRIRALRGICEGCEAAVALVEQGLAALRSEVTAAEAQRDELQRRIQGTQARHQAREAWDRLDPKREGVMLSLVKETAGR